MTESRSKPTAPVMVGSPRTLLPWKPQQSILQTLDLTRATAEAFPSGLAGFNLLNRPLIVGPSGIGKSTLVTHWAQTQGMAVFTITPASWIVLGATHHTPTLHLIESHLRHHAEPFVIFLDHLDGYRPGPDSWTRSVHEELLMLLDKRIQPDINPLLDKVFLIGAGSWADEFRDKTRYLPSSEVLEYQQTIPPDILNRFSWPPLLLPALERADFAGFLTRMALEYMKEPINPRTLDELCASAVRSERNFRWLESHAEDNARLMAMAQLHQH
ncbi:ATP-binding protein [Kamptonema cortianum]|nr:ATP-binding protein [Kamptonema cortianum]